MPTATQSVTHMTLPSCTGSDRYCSSERGIGQEQHIVALEFAHQNPPFEFYVPRSPSVDNSIDGRITPQSTGAGLVPQNTQVKIPHQDDRPLFNIFLTFLVSGWKFGNK